MEKPIAVAVESFEIAWRQEGGLVPGDFPVGILVRDPEEPIYETPGNLDAGTGRVRPTLHVKALLVDIFGIDDVLHLAVFFAS